MSIRSLILLAGILNCPVPAFAQPPLEGPRTWTITASAGLALTSGNRDTSTVNASYDITYDPQQRNLVKSDGLLIRGALDGDLVSDRLGFNLRDEFKVTERMYVFGQNRYLRDRFKNIDYHIAPGVGAGYQIVETPETRMDLDAGLGGVWERNRGGSVRTSGAVTFGENLQHTLTETTQLTQTFSGLWTTDDFSDALYALNVGISASMSARTQLKVELLDTYKSQPPLPTVEKNDLVIIVAIVYKI